MKGSRVESLESSRAMLVSILSIFALVGFIAVRTRSSKFLLSSAMLCGFQYRKYVRPRPKAVRSSAAACSLWSRGQSRMLFLRFIPSACSTALMRFASDATVGFSSGIPKEYITVAQNRGGWNPVALNSSLLPSKLPATADLRHVRQHVGHHGHGGYVHAKILQIDFIRRIRFGVVPVEIVGAYGVDSDAGDSVVH